MKAWLRRGREQEKSGGLLEHLVERLSRNLYGKDEDKTVRKDACRNGSENGKSENELKVKDTKRKVSSSESTSDLSDYSLLPESTEGQDRNNNFCFYDRRLIDLPEDKLLDKQLSRVSDDERRETNKRPRKPAVQIWPKLSRSIYYSHYFYLLYSCFNVNGAQRSDFLSMVRNFVWTFSKLENKFSYWRLDGRLSNF